MRAESCWAGIDVTSSQGAGGTPAYFDRMFSPVYRPRGHACIFIGRSEDLVGICDGGKLYVVHNADKMNYAE